MDVGQVFAGSLSVRRVWGFVERLLDEPWSRYRAHELGGENWREHVGWGPAEYLRAAQLDALNVLISVADAHRVSKRPKKPELVARPSVEVRQPHSLAELPLAAIEAMINS